MSPFNQQLDLDGGRHDIAPAHETVKLFDSAQQIRGQIALETDWCDEAACPVDECVECQRVFAPGDGVVFRNVGDEHERSGEFGSDEGPFGLVVWGRADGRRHYLPSGNVRAETADEHRERFEYGYYVERPRPRLGEPIPSDEPGFASELADARSFYVHRFSPDGHEGWTGSLRPLSRALREAQAWLDSDWSAEVVPNTPAIRAKVKAWERAAREGRAS